MGKEGIGDVMNDSIILTRYRPQRFINKSLTMYRVTIVASAATVVMGRQGKQDFPMVANASYTFQNVDLADLVFRDDTAASTVYMIGTTKD